MAAASVPRASDAGGVTTVAAGSPHASLFAVQLGTNNQPPHRCGHVACCGKGDLPVWKGQDFGTRGFGRLSSREINLETRA